MNFNPDTDLCPDCKGEDLWDDGPCPTCHDTKLKPHPTDKKDIHALEHLATRFMGQRITDPRDAERVYRALHTIAAILPTHMKDDTP